MKYYATIIILVIIDQISKLVVRMNMYEGQSIQVIGKFFQITHIRNDGAAFSMLSGQRVFLIIVPIIAVGIALWYMIKHMKTDHFTLSLALSFIISGGIGNLIDRVAFGSVTDMFDFSIFPPVFNIADIAVCVGCGLLFLFVLVFDGAKNGAK